MNNYAREISDICTIFNEVTGGLASPTRDAAVLVNFIKNHQWQAYDFRLVIEHSIKDESTRAFLNQPGRMNLRSIFGQHRVDLVLDLHSDLKRVKDIQQKSLLAIDSTPDMKTLSMRLSCGHIFEKKFIKVLDPSVKKSENTPGGYRWRSGNSEELENHPYPC